MRKILQAISIFCMLGSCFASTGYPNEVTNLHLENVTQVSFDVVWALNHAGTCQVILARDTNYEPERWIPGVPDPTLVTGCRVHVDHLLPYNPSGDGQYYGYVASVDATGKLSTSPGPQTPDGRNPLLPMRTLAPDTSASPNMLIYTQGPHTAYTGHDMYFEMRSVLLGGPVASLYIQNQGGYNNSTDGVVSYLGGANPLGSPKKIHPHFVCVWSNRSASDTADQSFDRSKHLGFCPSGNNKGHGDLKMRLRVDETAAPGNYSVRVTTIQNGQQVAFDYPFQVVKTPTSIPFASVKRFRPLDLTTWEQQMVALGNKWCTYRDQQDAAGNFDLSWGVQIDAWFYDGGRVFQDVDKYTTLKGHPDTAHWRHCAQGILNPYAGYQNQTGGNMQMYSVFTRGMAKNYFQTNDPVMKTAIAALVNGVQGQSVGAVDLYELRENAYRATMFLSHWSVGNPVHPLLQQHADKLIGMMEMIADEEPGDVASGSHPFMVGLAMDALIGWWDYTVATGHPDYRVFPAIKGALDATWRDKWVESLGLLDYNHDRVPANPSNVYSSLNMLNAEAYAWYWALTGDSSEQERAMKLFAHVFDSPGNYTYSGKVFSQVFEFSFNTVGYLTKQNFVSWETSSQNPFSGPWPVTNVPAMFQVNCDPNYFRGCKAGTIGRTTATIDWYTFVPTSRQIIYGTSTNYGQLSPPSSTLTLYQPITLTGLQPGTKYHYKAKSVDQYGNTAVMHDLTFTTLP